MHTQLTPELYGEGVAREELAIGDLSPAAVDGYRPIAARYGDGARSHDVLAWKQVWIKGKGVGVEM